LRQIGVVELFQSITAVTTSGNYLQCKGIALRSEHSEGYDIESMGFGSTEYIHHFIEAKKLAFEIAPGSTPTPPSMKFQSTN
jgi:gamma-glutamyltranspeptidase